MATADYYAIDALLADTHKLACTFTLDVAGIGFLEGGNERDIKQYAKAELPFWMAERLSFQCARFLHVPPLSPLLIPGIDQRLYNLSHSGTLLRPRPLRAQRLRHEHQPRLPRRRQRMVVHVRPQHLRAVCPPTPLLPPLILDAQG